MRKEDDSVIIRESPMAIPTILGASWRAQPKETVCLIGEPSTGKSEGVEAFSMLQADVERREPFFWNDESYERKIDAIANPKKYFVHVDFRAAETDVGELRLQEMSNGKNYITYKYAMVFELLSKQEAMGILFFDEMNLAPNIVKSQFYKVFNDHCIGDIPLSKDVMVIAAGNEMRHARNASEDPMPLVLRRGNYFLRPFTDEEYVDWSVQNGQHEWISGYLKMAPQDTHGIDYDQHNGMGQPCPRTWTKLSRILVGNQKLSEDEVAMFTRAYVGQGVAKKFTAYVKMARKIDIEEVLKDPKRVKEIDQLDVLYAVITGALEKYRVQKGKVSEKVFELSSNMREELGAFMLRNMKAMNEAQFKKLAMDSKEFDKLATKYAPFFT
jgi:hypothetical protein